MKALIDTCIIIDYLQLRQPFFADAREIVMSAAANHFDGFFTAKSATDIYYLMHRFFHDDKITRKALSDLFILFRVLDTAALDCRLAILSSVGDYEDAVLAETAIRTEMDCIVTRNLQDFNFSSVPVYSPHDFLNLL